MCNPSSREINSFEKVNPGIKERFFNQNIEQKLPEKKIPSTAEKAISLSLNFWLLLIHFIALKLTLVKIPLGLFVDNRDVSNSIEQKLLFISVFNVSVN